MRIASYFLFISSLLLLSGSIWSYIVNAEFVSTAQETTGEVVELVERNSDDSTTFAPVFVYLDKSGAKHKIYSSTSSYPPAYELGEIVPVLYNESDHKSAVINSTFNIWGLAIILAIVGLIDFIMAIVFHIIGRKQSAEKIKTNKAINTDAE